MSNDPILKTKIKFVLILISPLFYFGVLFIVLALNLYRQKNMHMLKSYTITSIVIIVFNMIPGIVKSCLNFMNCRNLNTESDPVTFYIENYDMQCWVNPHRQLVFYLIIPSLLTWMIIAPLWLFIKLYRNKTKINQTQLLQRYSFIYNGYKGENYYWEFIILIRKVIGISIIVFFGIKSPTLQILFTLFLNSLYLYVHMLYMPYVERKLNVVESFGILTSILLCISSVYFKFRNEDTTISEFDPFIVLVIIVGSASFVLLVILEFLSTTKLKNCEFLKRKKKRSKKMFRLGDGKKIFKSRTDEYKKTDKDNQETISQDTLLVEDLK
jgi:hypothetical protein